jgi:hypothetical protein
MPALDYKVQLAPWDRSVDGIELTLAGGVGMVMDWLDGPVNRPGIRQKSWQVMATY